MYPDGSTIFLQAEQIASIKKVSKFKDAGDVVIGEDNTLKFTSLSMDNGGIITVKESPEGIANATGAFICDVAEYETKAAAKRAYDAVKDPAPAWSPDANLERSRKCCEGTTIGVLPTGAN